MSDYTKGFALKSNLVTEICVEALSNIWRCFCNVSIRMKL